MEMELVSADTVAQLRSWEARVLEGLRRLRGQTGPQVVLQEAHFTSTAGYRIAAVMAIPDGPGPHPGVVICPDGSGGLASVREGAAPVSVAGLVARGLAVMLFDPAGRGDSWGEEDHGGPEHQDNAAAALRRLAGEDRVDGTRVGLLGLGLGSLAAVGAAARQGAPAAWVVDWEGPADRETVLAIGGEDWAGPDDATWWADRSPAQMVSALACPYIRLQAEDDHARPGELRHALRMMWAASSRGGWFQINDHPPGEAVGRPVWLPSGALAARAALYRKLAVLGGVSVPARRSTHA